MAKKSSFEVSVQIAPISGTPTEKTVTVPEGSTVGDVAKAAGITDVSKLNLYYDGKPATPGTRVTAASAVKVTERPQGS